MITLARRLERTKGVIGTLLAGLLLLCATDAPRSHADANEWRATVSVSAPAAIGGSAIRARDPGTRTPRSATRALELAPTRAFTLDLAAPASSPRATLARIERPNAVAVRGYDATAPPRIS